MQPAPNPARTPARAAEEWLTPRRFACVLALLIAATFPGILIGSSTFVVRDFGMFSYPVAYFHRESFWRGELPFWNPYSNCGVPFLAQWNTLALYPPSLIYLLLPLAWSLPLFCLIHVFWGGMGMYFLARRWTNNCLGAGLAGIIFSFNGLSLNFLMWPSHIATFAWLPWVLLLGQRAWNEGGRIFVWAVLAGAAEMLAGGPETIAVTWGILGILVCGDWICRNGPRGKIVLRFLALGCLVALLCAAQLLPFLELLAHSQRDSGYAASTHDWSMPFWGWANFLVPLFRTAPTPQGVFLQTGQYWTSSYYAGIATVLLVAIAFRRNRDWRVLALGALLLVGMVLALGNGTLLYRALLFCFPQMGFVRYPVKFVILVLAVAPLLAAFGFTKLAETSQRPGRFEITFGAILFLLIGVIVAVDWKSPLPDGVWKATWQNGASRAFFLIVTFGILAALAGTEGRRRTLLSCFLLAVFWLDFNTHAPTQNPNAKPFIYTPGWAKSQNRLDPQPQLGESRAMVDPQALDYLKHYPLPNVDETYLRNRLALRVNCNLLDAVPQVDGFFSLTPREAFRTAALPYDHPDKQYPALLDFLGVSQMTVLETNIDWVKRPNAMKIASAGQRAVFANDQAAFDSFSQTNVDFHQTVILPEEARGRVSATAQNAARVSDEKFANQLVTLKVESPSPALVVISQSYYPAWKAYVDGTATKIWRANYAFQALEVPAGTHDVKLVYEDHKFKVGSVLSLLGLVACGGIWLQASRSIKPVEVRSGTFPQTTPASATT